MTNALIPHTAVWITEREIAAVQALLRDGRIDSNKDTLKAAEEALLPFTDGHPSLLTTSCTTAMELALRCIDIRPHDEVIIPSYTFVSTANAILQCGGRPVLIDIEEETLCMDVSRAQEACTERTRAIMPVHYGGISCDMDALLRLSQEKRLHIIEDAAHAIGARYKSKHLGTIGTFGCFSFHHSKNCVAGEGGALVINDQRFLERAELICEKGTNRGAFLRGEVDKYMWVCHGGSYTISALLATLLEVQLSRYEEILQGRQHVVRRYKEELRSLVDEGHIRFTDIPDYATPNEHLAFFLMRQAERRDALLAHLQAESIQAYFHYVPLHLSPYAQEHLGSKPGQFPIAERVAASIVRLPLYPHMRDDDCSRVIESVLRFFHPDQPRSARVGIPTSDRAITSFDLSLVVPCYQEAHHLTRNLDEIMRTLDRTSLRYEIILIDDASTDGTADLIRRYVAIHPHCNLRTVFHAKNQGRGATVQEGLRMAYGRLAGFLDVDLEISARYIPSALAPLISGEADMVVADRQYVFHVRTLLRFLTTKAYRWVVHRLLEVPFDTEAGFKFFRRDRIIPVLEDVRDRHWFWDTEVTVRSRDKGLRIRSERVLFLRKLEKASTVRLLRDGYRSLVALVRFRKERLKR